MLPDFSESSNAHKELLTLLETGGADTLTWGTSLLCDIAGHQRLADLPASAGAVQEDEG